MNFEFYQNILSKYLPEILFHNKLYITQNTSFFLGLSGITKNMDKFWKILNVKEIFYIYILTNFKLEKIFAIKPPFT